MATKKEEPTAEETGGMPTQNLEDALAAPGAPNSGDAADKEGKGQIKERSISPTPLQQDSAGAVGSPFSP